METTLTEQESNKKKDTFFIFFVFALFFFVACYKLVYASLWFDETIEYWYSKIMFGKLPYEINFNKQSTNMYQRIISTYQPPLYNFIMFFWLKIYDSEWWFRFSGVVFGLLGMTGLFKTVKLLTKNTYVSLFSVIFATFTWRLIYYYQECAEYTLLLTTLFWDIYFFAKLYKETSVKNIIMFTVFSVLPVYSQYGAVFPVFVMLVTAFIFVIMKKDKKLTVAILISYGTALILFALPLFLLFIRPQLIKQSSMHSEVRKLLFEGSFFSDIYTSLLSVFRWSFYNNYALASVKGIFIVSILLVSISCIFGRNVFYKIYVGVNFCIYIMYFFAVKLGFYANVSYVKTQFGNRYNLFFIPLWIVLTFLTYSEIIDCINNYSKKRIFKFSFPKYLDLFFCSVVVCFIVCYSFSSWSKELTANWTKQDTRGGVEEWYKNDGYKMPTITSFSGANGFCFYLRHHEKYSPDLEKNVYYVNFAKEEKVADWLSNTFSVKPEKIFYFENHNQKDVENYLKMFSNFGYTSKPVYKKILYCLERKETANEKNIREAILKFRNTARIDVKNFGNESNNLEVMSISDSTNTFKPQKWYTDQKGTGYMLQSTDAKLDAELKMHGNGVIRFSLRGVDWKDLDKKRIPMKIDYTDFSVNGKSLLKEKTTVWHDKPFIYELPVKDGEIVTVHAEWQPVE